MEQDQGQSGEDQGGVRKVRVVDVVELKPLGAELHIGSKELSFDAEGKLINVRRLPSTTIKIPTVAS